MMSICQQDEPKSLHIRHLSSAIRWHAPCCCFGSHIRGERRNMGTEDAMKTMRGFAVVAFLGTLIAPAMASAKVVTIETTAALPDLSDRSIDGALENAVDTC